MTNRAKGVPCKFETYWDTKCLNLWICAIQNGDRSGRERAIGLFGPFSGPGAIYSAAPVEHYLCGGTDAGALAKRGAALVNQAAKGADVAHRDTQATVTIEELPVATLATSERKLVSVRLDQRGTTSQKRRFAMRKGICMLGITAFLLAVVQISTVVRADDARGGGQEAFVGLWQAIDSFDGSTQLLSITCTRDRSCDVRLNDTAFTLSCQNQIGFARGMGSIKGNTLTVELTLYCSNLDGTSSLAATQENAFVLDRRNKTLTNINDDPLPAPNVFHKISQ